MTIEEKIKRRKKDNLFLENLVRLYQEIYPELRYIQSLWALGIIDKENKVIDRFYEEPYDTIVRILPTIQTLLLVIDSMDKKNTAIKFKVSNIYHYLNELNLL